MDIDRAAITAVDGVAESSRYNELLASAAARIDELIADRRAVELGELLDWVAFFTREQFGFQMRLLNECSQQREYLLGRVAVHYDFRRRLAQLCIDAMCGDRTVPERFRAICRDLLDDAQAHHEVFSDLVRNSGINPKLRRSPRRGQLATNSETWLDKPEAASH